MVQDGFEKIKTKLLNKLKGLSPYLTYHCLNHTVDILKQCERIANAEEITKEKDLILLRLAALYHDSGFLEAYAEHEIKSCAIFMKDAVDFDFTDKEKDIICGLIMATRIPQQPHTVMENIICDADLDYLGRTDFSIIANTLKKEFLHYKIVGNNDEWSKLQLKFLQNHTYHTVTSQKQREPVKQQNISYLINKIPPGIVY